ncbi:MAG: GAF domain-containing protein [Synechococcus sp.]|nr:GAF domain-containing protein [Synechococcus sp.]
MRPPESLPHETERLRSLFQQELLDSPPEQTFDDLVALTKHLFNVDIALVSLVDDQRQWFKAKAGLEPNETSREISFCGHALHGDDIFEVPDAQVDDRFCDNPLVVGEPYIRFYAGQPIYGDDGHKLGTLCLIHHAPRKLNAPEREQLKMLARQVEHLIKLRRKLIRRQKQIGFLTAQIAALYQSHSRQERILTGLSYEVPTKLQAFRQGMEQLSALVLAPEELELWRPDLSPQPKGDGNDLQQLAHRLCTQFIQADIEINQIWHWNQQQLQMSTVPMELFSAAAIALEILPWCSEYIQPRKVILQTQLDTDLQVFGNPELVAVVLQKLVANAVKYCRQGDTVTIFARREGEHGVLGVTDTGIGMEPNTLKLLRSQSYQRSPLDLAPALEGGCGVLLCQTYLNEMGANLNIDSRWAEGSTFSFRLAIAPTLTTLA